MKAEHMETNKDLQCIFVNYLEQMGAKNNYLTECIERLGYEPTSWVELLNKSPRNWVKCNFNWTKSSDNYHYWKHIDDVWQVVIIAYEAGGAQ